MMMLLTARIILGIAAAVAPRQTDALAFSTQAYNVGATSRSIIRRITTASAAANKEICKTTVADQGSAEASSTVSGEGYRSSLFSDALINAAEKKSIKQRKKLKELGALDIERAIRIVGKPVTDSKILSSNTKIIHFQRHGQGYHNLICDMWKEQGMLVDLDSADPNLNPIVRPEFLDPPLTARGMQQCRSQRDLCATLSPELVIVSPLLRCIQTARLSFRDRVDEVPWLSHEGCREELGLLEANKRRSIDDIRADYPGIDFSAIEHNEDVPWEEYGDRLETPLEKSERIYEFLTEYVMNRPEKEIAIVSHSAYLFTLLNAVVDIEDEPLRRWFLTSEVRTLQVTFVHREG